MYFQSLCFSTLVFVASSFGGVASANDLDHLLSTGSCSNCYIDGGNLDGRTLNWGSIQNSIVRNLSLKGAKITIQSVDMATLEALDFTGASISVLDLTDSTIRDASLNSANIRFENIQNSSLLRVGFSSAALNVGTMYKSELEASTAVGSFVSFDDLREATMSQVNFDNSSLTIRGHNARLAEVSCKNCGMRFSNSSRSAGVDTASFSIDASNLTSARIAYPADVRLNLSGGTLLNHAIVNNRRCSAWSTDTCN